VVFPREGCLFSLRLFLGRLYALLPRTPSFFLFNSEGDVSCPPSAPAEPPFPVQPSFDSDPPFPFDEASTPCVREKTIPHCRNKFFSFCLFFYCAKAFRITPVFFPQGSNGFFKILMDPCNSDYAVNMADFPPSTPPILRSSQILPHVFLDRKIQEGLWAPLYEKKDISSLLFSGDERQIPLCREGNPFPSRGRDLLFPLLFGRSFDPSFHIYGFPNRVCWILF